MRGWLGVVLLSGVVALAGCGGGADSPPAAPSGSPLGSQHVSSSPAVSRTAPTGRGRVRHGIAVPGARFSLRKAVAIRFHAGRRTGVLAVKIRSITRGRTRQLKPLGLGGRVRGMSPYYIRFLVKNLSRTDLSRVWVKDLVGVTARGREARHVLVIGPFPRCPASRTPRHFTKGHMTTLCSLAVAPHGVRVSGARWRGEPYGPATDRAITWM